MSSYVESTNPDGNAILVLKNSHMEVWFMSMGASILKILVKDKDGNWQDVVLGYEKTEDYPKYRAYLGAIVGRVANRIANGTFALNGREYHVPVNNGPNCNHGGIDGFSFRNFSYTLLENSIIFKLHSPDMEEGFPGNADCIITYTLQDNTLLIHYEAISDADTIFNFTNHTYFNLDGKPDYIGSHTLQIAADEFAPTDENGLVTGQLLEVKNSAFDFRKAKKIAKALEDEENEQIRLGRGLDHSFVLKNCQDPVILHSDETGITLKVNTTLPMAQIYTANYFDGEPGKSGTILARQYGTAIETQNWPNDINLHGQQGKTVYKKGEKLDETTSFTFEVSQ